MFQEEAHASFFKWGFSTFYFILFFLVVNIMVSILIMLSFLVKQTKSNYILKREKWKSVTNVWYYIPNLDHIIYKILTMYTSPSTSPEVRDKKHRNKIQCSTYKLAVIDCVICSFHLIYSPLKSKMLFPFLTSSSSHEILKIIISKRCWCWWHCLMSVLGKFPLGRIIWFNWVPLEICLLLHPHLAAPGSMIWVILFLEKSQN